MKHLNQDNPHQIEEKKEEVDQLSVTLPQDDNNNAVAQTTTQDPPNSVTPLDASNTDQLNKVINNV